MKAIFMSLVFILIGLSGIAQSENNNYKIAKAKCKSGSNKSALKYFNKALEEDSSLMNDAVFFFERGSCKMNLRNNKGAIKDYTQAINLNEFYVDAYYNRGTCKMATRDFKGAITDFTKSIELFPKDKDSFLNRALCKRKIRDNDGAMDDYNKAIKFGPRDGDAYYERGLFKIQLGDLYGACHDFDRANTLGIWEAEEAIQEYCRY